MRARHDVDGCSVKSPAEFEDAIGMSGREPDPATYMIDVKVTGIVNAARKIPIIASSHSQEANEGRKTLVR
jgi:hypothetical protein